VRLTGLARPHLRPGQPPQVRAHAVGPLLLTPLRQPPGLGLHRLVHVFGFASASRGRYGPLLPTPHLWGDGAARLLQRAPPLVLHGRGASMNLLHHHPSTSCAIQPPGSGLPHPNQAASRVRLAILPVSVQR
jgi:hypothetical protein